MDWLKKQTPVYRSPPGLEWKIFKKIHWISLGGLLLLSIFAWAGRWYATCASLNQIDDWITQWDFMLWGVFFFFVSMMIALTVGCVLVIIMKGPRYTADPYVLPDADRPQK